MEAVAVARRALHLAALFEDYAFERLGPDGKTAKVSFSELFATTEII